MQDQNGHGRVLLHRVLKSLCAVRAQPLHIVDQQGYTDQTHIQNVEWTNMPIVYGFTRTEENQDIILAINDLLDEMHEDGTLAELSDKWFGMDVTALPEGEVNYVTTTGEDAWQSYEG